MISSFPKGNLEGAMELVFVIVLKPFNEGLRGGPRHDLLQCLHFVVALPLALCYETPEMLTVQGCFQRKRLSFGKQ